MFGSKSCSCSIKVIRLLITGRRHTVRGPILYPFFIVTYLSSQGREYFEYHSSSFLVRYRTPHVVPRSRELVRPQFIIDRFSYPSFFLFRSDFPFNISPCKFSFSFFLVGTKEETFHLFTCEHVVDDTRSTEYVKWCKWGVSLGVSSYNKRGEVLPISTRSFCIPRNTS